MASGDTSIQQLVCAICGTPFAFESQTEIRFPDDARAVLDAIAIEPLVRPCEVCGHRALLPPSLLYLNVRTNELLVFGPEELLRDAIEAGRTEAGVPSFSRVTFATEHEQLRQRLIVWTNELLATALMPMLRDKDMSKWPRGDDGTLLCQSYFVLLALAHARTGKVPFRIQTEPPITNEKAEELLTALRHLTATGAFREAYKVAFHAPDGIGTLPDVVGQRIPPEAATDDVLEEFWKGCTVVTEALKDPQVFDAAYRFEYLTAVAYQLAGKPNPNEAQWALLMVTLFAMSRRGQVGIDERFLLGSKVLRATIGPETFLRLLFSLFPLSYEGKVDRELHALALDVAMHFGYEKELMAAIATQLAGWTIDPDGKISDEELAEKLGGIAARAGNEFSRDVALATIPRLCETLLRSGRTRAARLLAQRELESLADSDEAFVRALCRVSEVFNDMRVHSANLELLQAFTERIRAAMETLPPAVIVDYFNEYGNTLRYLQKAEEAIRVYNVALEVTEGDDELRRERNILRRNIGIALRESDRPATSRRILLEGVREAEDDQDRLAARENLIATLLHMRAFEEALFHARINAAVPLYAAEPRFRLIALMQLAMAKVQMNVSLEDELHEAMQLGELLPQFRPSIASTTFFVALRTEVSRPLVDAAIGIAHSMPFNGPFELTALLMYAEWQAERDPDAARATIDRVLEAIGPKVSMPWEWSYLRFRLAGEESFMERWPLLLAALERLRDDVPADTSGGLLAAWLSEKDPYLNDLVVFGKEAYRRGIATPSDLLQIANVANGRDVVIPLGETNDSPLPHARIIAFLEDDADIWIVATTLDGEHLDIVPDVLATKEVVAANLQFQRAIRRALPGHPSRADSIIAPLLRRIGDAVAALVPPNEQICFVPSDSLVALPLHAATVAGDTLLIARNPISVSPNLGVIEDLVRATTRAGRRSVVVAVPKRGDAEHFSGALRDAARVVEKLLPGVVETLLETAATKESCQSAALDARHAVFLCHGADAGARYGRGLCVSDGTDVPPPLLPVAEAPSLRRFILTAEDVESWNPSPEVFATIACSSGLSVPGPAGSRLGVERSLMMNGCRTILAPMWDVDHVSALRFLADFYGICHKDPEVDLGHAHQQATILAYERSPHLFDWAPMQLKGSWIRPKGEFHDDPDNADPRPLS